MLINNRILLRSAGGTITDVSKELTDFHANTKTITLPAADGALYLGSDLPFNHRFIDINTVNANTSVLDVKVWDGSTFVAVVDTIDETDSAGVAFAKSEILSWTKDRDTSWTREDTTEDIPELSTITIYDLYWAKITWSLDLNALTLNYIGHNFTSDDEFGSLYPTLNSSNVKDQFESGKTDWKEQQIEAAERIIKWLRRNERIFSVNQLMNWDIFADAARHATASIIFRELGDDFISDRERAEDDYNDAINLKNFQVDLNRDGRPNIAEKRQTTRFRRI